MLAPNIDELEAREVVVVVADDHPAVGHSTL
jgi:hypothetical protein